MTPLFVPLLAGVAGLAHAASIAAPWSGEPVWWLQLLAMGTLVWQIDQAASPRQAAKLGWIFATAWLCGTFWWLYISMHTYGGLNPVVTVLAIFALAAVLALYYALASYAFKRVGLANRSQAALFFAVAWTMAEMARGTWFTGFGWGAAGYAHIESLGKLAKYVGAYGLAALAAFIAASLALCLRGGWGGIFSGKFSGASNVSLRRPSALKALAPVLLIAVLAQVADRQFSAPGATLSVALLQGNIKQSEKFQPSTGIVYALTWYGQEALAAKAALVVAPETAIPILPQQLPDDYWARLSRSFAPGGGNTNAADGTRSANDMNVTSAASVASAATTVTTATPATTATVGERALLIGIPLGSYSAGYTNSVVGLKPGLPLSPDSSAEQTMRSVYRYDKHHLVPFGEFIPPLFKWFTQMMNIPLGDFNRGDVGQPSFEWQGQRLAPNICYEDLFGEELAARFIDPKKAPTIFVNLSNIGWFGNTLAIDQHRAISRMRALEFERPFIRATNTGDTVVIDHTGRVTHSLPRHTRGVLLGQVQGRVADTAPGAAAVSGAAGGVSVAGAVEVAAASTAESNAATGGQVTPFAWWAARFGLYPIWGCCLFFIFTLLIINNKLNKK